MDGTAFCGIQIDFIGSEIQFIFLLGSRFFSLKNEIL